MKKRTILIIIGLVLAVGLFYGGRSVYYEFYPVPKESSAEWEPFVRALDAKREAFFVENDGINIEVRGLLEYCLDRFAVDEKGNAYVTGATSSDESTLSMSRVNFSGASINRNSSVF